MKIQLIWAQDKEGGIGKNGNLPWYIPEDLKNFKKITSNHPIIMGRLTWESLPIQPLPNRRNIILTKNTYPNVECYNKIEDCLKILENDNIESVFIIGGSSIYLSFLDIATDLHITIIHKNINGIDCYFPTTLTQLKNNFILSYKNELSLDATYMHWVRK